MCAVSRSIVKKGLRKSIGSVFPENVLFGGNECPHKIWSMVIPHLLARVTARANNEKERRRNAVANQLRITQFVP